MSTDIREQLTDALSSRYAVDRLIGSGGMATVYLARDLRHDRQVALKVLNPELGAVLGSERFLSEIKVTANLQHPNLLPLFDSGDAEGLLFYVMPYVEGESLRARLDREKQLPVDEAVRLAIAVASALDYAHRRGVIHRDLKPENILLHEGQPLVADFGIALAVSKAGGNRVTQTGLSLGTPQYMSPEQATGDRVIDARADIYSLGAVLYEMLAGDPPHLGSTAQAIIAKVLTEKPPHVRIARDAVPENIDWAIEKALAKLPADRFGTARELAEALQANAGARAGTRRASPPKWYAKAGSAWPWLVALALAIGLGLWGTFRSHDDVGNPTVRFLVDLPPQQDPIIKGIALSPEGSSLVWAGSLGIVVRSMSDIEPHLLAGTAGANQPFFSPDGKWVAFLNDDDSKLRKVPVAGGSSVILTDSMESITGAVWTRNDEIIFTGRNHGLNIISAGGGKPRPLTIPARGDRHMWPALLPDGKSIIFTLWHGGIQTAEVAAATLGGKVTRLGVRGIGPQYVDGNLIFAHPDGTLARVSFDPTRLRAGSEEHSLGETVFVTNPAMAQYAVSRNGGFAYLRGVLPNQPVIVDRAGTMRPLALEERTYARPRFSPDGQRILFDTRGAAFGEIWVYDTGSATAQRLFVGEDVHQPEWRPDGKALSFTARNDTTQEDLFVMPLDQSSPPQSVAKLARDQFDATWTPDGRALVYLDNTPFLTIGLIHLDDRKPSKWLDAGPPGGTLLGPRVSPDGHWIAYWSNQSGKVEVYVRPFPGSGGVTQVSSGGGAEPVWSRDSRNLYYRNDEKLMMATLTGISELHVTGRQLVFAQQFVSDGGHTFYGVSPDGKSFVFLKNSVRQAQIVVVLNWGNALRGKLVRQ